MERDIFYRGVSYADEDTADYIEWSGNNSIYISEIESEISIGTIRAELPNVISYPLGIVRFLFVVAMDAMENHFKTKSVRDLPLYPGDIYGNQSQYQEKRENVFRSFNIEQEDIDDVAKWYMQTLSNHPWEINDIFCHTTSSDTGMVSLRYCIIVTRTFEDKHRIYYWEFMENDRSHSVHVNIGSPYPITDTCKRYVESP